MGGLSFSENNIPKVHLDFAAIQDKKLAVLTIYNERLKPYYLTKISNKASKMTRLGVVYSRVGDSNTPRDSCANSSDVIKMWRERFSLDSPPLERFSSILEDVDNWEYDGISSAYYKLDPDYKINIGEKTEEGNNRWWLDHPVEKPIQYEYHLIYRGQVLWSLPIVHYRNENLKFPYPDVEYVNYPGSQSENKIDFYCDLYFFQRNTLHFSLFKHIRLCEVASPKLNSLSAPIRSQIKPSIFGLPFFIVDDQSEVEQLKERFLELCPEFMRVRSELQRKRFSNINPSRLEVEMLFSEWIFEEISKEGLKTAEELVPTN